MSCHLALPASMPASMLSSIVDFNSQNISQNKSFLLFSVLVMIFYHNSRRIINGKCLLVSGTH